MKKYSVSTFYEGEVFYVITLKMFLIPKKCNRRCTGLERWAKGKPDLQTQLSGPPSEGGEDGGSCGD